MDEIVIDDIVGGFIGLCDVVVLHKRDKETLAAKESLDLLDSLTLGVDLLLWKTQVDQDEQFDIQPL